MNKDTVNGFPVVASFEFPARGGAPAGRVIIIDREVEFIRYVVATQYGSPGERQVGWSAGFYAAHWNMAQADFLRLVGREIEFMEVSLSQAEEVA